MEIQNELTQPAVNQGDQPHPYMRIISKVTKNESTIRFLADLDFDYKWSWTKDILGFLPEEARQNWNCQTCRETFKRHANTVVCDYNTELATLQVSSLFWSEENTPAELAAAGANVRSILAKSLENPRLVPLKYNPVLELITGGGNTWSIGTAKAGGFNHICASITDDVRINRNTRRHAAARHSMTIALQNYRGADVSEVVETLIQIVEAETAGDQNTAGRVKSHLTSLRTFVGAYNTIHHTGLSVDNVLSTLSDDALDRIIHFRSSAIGELLNAVLEHNADYAGAVKSYIHNIDPQFYQRAQAAADARDFKAFKSFVETNFPNALELKICTESELDVDWLGQQVIAEEVVDEASEETARQAFGVLEELVGENEKTKKPAAPAVVDVQQIKSVSVEQFMKLLNEGSVVSLESNIPINNIRCSVLQTLKYGSPADADWPLKAGITHIPVTYSRPLPSRAYGLGGGWTPLGLLKTPVGIGSERDETFLTIAMPKDAEIWKHMSAGLFAESYRAEFYEHRRAMEGLLAKIQAQVGAGNYVIGILPVGSGNMYRVRLKDSNIRQIYQVVQLSE